jgi:chemotaxis protein CheD
VDIVVGISDMKCSSKKEDVLVTYALGSCIAVAVHDPEAGVAGLLHFMLPDSTLDRGKASQLPAMFADTGIPLLFKACYQLGAEKRRMTVKVAGGASILSDTDYFRIGQKNITAMRKIFWRNNVLIASEDTGATYNRTVRLSVADGRCQVKVSNGTLKDM